MSAEEHITHISSDVIARGVDLADYVARYAGDFHEYIDGVVIQMSPVSAKHDQLSFYLRQLVEFYFVYRPIGAVRSAPFMLRLPAFPNRRREPDLQIILKDNPGELTVTYMDGLADICIEIVSIDSVTRDYNEKFAEYEQGGVREYWIIDPMRAICDFHRLGDDGHYARIAAGADEVYNTPLLPDFALHVPTLWQTELPNPVTTGEMVQRMLDEA